MTLRFRALLFLLGGAAVAMALTAALAQFILTPRALGAERELLASQIRRVEVKLALELQRLEYAATRWAAAEYVQARFAGRANRLEERVQQTTSYRTTRASFLTFWTPERRWIAGGFAAERDGPVEPVPAAWRTALAARLTGDAAAPRTASGYFALDGEVVAYAIAPVRVPGGAAAGWTVVARRFGGASNLVAELTTAEQFTLTPLATTEAPATEGFAPGERHWIRIRDGLSAAWFPLAPPAGTPAASLRLDSIAQYYRQSRHATDTFLGALALLSVAGVGLAAWMLDLSLAQRLTRLGQRLHLLGKGSKAPIESSLQTFDADLAAVERRVERAESAYQLVLDSLPDLLCRYRPDGTLTFINGAFCRFCARTPEQLLGRPVWECLARDETAGEPAGPTAGSGERVRHIAVRRADGVRRWLRWEEQFLPGTPTEVQAAGRDVTAEREAEATARRAGEQLRQFFADSPFAVAMLDRDRRFLHVSHHWCHALRVEPASLLGRRYREVFPMVPHEWDEQHARALAGETIDTPEESVVRPDGSTEWVHRVVRPWREASGEVGGIVLFVEFITARRLAEQQLRESRQLYRDLSDRFSYALHSGGAGFWEWDRTSNACRWDDQFYRLHGIAPGSISPSYEQWRKRLHPDDLPHLRRVIGRIGRGATSGEVEYRVLSSDGRLRVHRGVWRTQSDGRGRPGRAFGLIYDISDQRAAEEKLARITAALPGVVFETEGRPGEEIQLTYISAGVERIFGVPAAEATLARLIACRHPDDSARVTAAIDVAIAEGQPYAVEYRIVRPDRQVRTLLSQGQPRRLADGRVQIFGMLFDITEQRVAEEKLALIGAELPGAVYEIEQDADGRFRLTYVTDGIGRIFGIEAPELTFERLVALRHPEDVARVAREIAAASAGGRAHEIEYRIIRPDGEVRWIFSRAIPSPRSDGRLLFFGMLFDVTERRAVQEKLRRLASQLPGALYEGRRTPDGRWSTPYVSEGISRLYPGVTCAEVQADSTCLRRFRPPEDEARIWAAVEESARSLKLFRCEFRILHPDGSIHWARSESQPEQLPDGTIIFHGLVLDITEQKRAEQGRENLAALVDGSTDFLALSELDGRLLYLNPAAQRLLGLPADPDGLALCDLVEGGVTWNRLILPQVTRSGAWQGVVRFRHRGSGDLVPVEQSLFLIRDPRTGHPALIGCRARDIRLQEAQQRALVDARDAAESANRAKSEFLATMSHEIRTPLNGVIGFAELLLDTQLDEEQLDFVRTITTSSRTLLALINNLLDFSRIEAGQLELAIETLDVGELAAEVVNLLQPRARERALALTVARPSAPLPRIEADSLRLRQVLTNLVGNAVKFTPQGRVTVHLDPVPLADGRPAVRFAVEDTGIGIAADKLERLFRPFSQVDSSASRRFQGTGLGLAISQRLVAALGGHIVVASREGEGTTFSFILPVRAAAPGALPAERVATIGRA